QKRANRRGRTLVPELVFPFLCLFVFFVAIRSLLRVPLLPSWRRGSIREVRSAGSIDALPIALERAHGLPGRLPPPLGPQPRPVPAWHRSLRAGVLPGPPVLLQSEPVFPPRSGAGRGRTAR